MAAVNDIYQVTPYGFMGNQLWQNVRHFKVSAVAGAGRTNLQIAQRFDAILRPLYLALLTASATFRAVAVQKIFPLPPSATVDSSTVSGSGLAGVEPLPSQTCGLISLTTDFAGRRYRGRMYLPFPTEEDSAGMAVPEPVYLGNATVLAAQFVGTQVVVTGPDSVSLQSVIWHRADNTTVPITGFKIREGWATQRRRGYFGRTNLTP